MLLKLNRVHDPRKIEKDSQFNDHFEVAPHISLPLQGSSTKAKVANITSQRGSNKKWAEISTVLAQILLDAVGYLLICHIDRILAVFLEVLETVRSQRGASDQVLPICKLERLDDKVLYKIIMPEINVRPYTHLYKPLTFEPC